jgi:hypothetical protein
MEILAGLIILGWLLWYTFTMQDINRNAKKTAQYVQVIANLLANQAGSDAIQIHRDMFPAPPRRTNTWSPIHAR